MDAAVPPAADLIVFDGKCIFCSAFARFMARRDVAGRFRFVTAHSALGQSLYLQHGLDPHLMETNIVIVGGKAHVKMAAFASAVGTLRWPWRGLAMLGMLPRRVADPVYDWIARNRYRFGRQVCVLPTAELKARLIE